MPSIVDPAEARGGAWTFTRGLIKAIGIAWPGSHVECVPLSSTSRASHRMRQLTKVAESLFNRVPVAATSFAVRGLPAEATRSVRVCDSPNEWIALLNSDAAREVACRAVPGEAAAYFSTVKAADALRSFSDSSSAQLTM